jgi:hypothetical protein
MIHRPPSWKPGDVTSGKVKLDMSEFHDLMHWPFTRHCRSLYGGGFHHLKATWRYRRKEQLLDLYRRPWHKIMCRLDRHEPRTHYRWNKTEDRWDPVTQCWWCYQKTKDV